MELFKCICLCHSLCLCLCQKSLGTLCSVVKTLIVSGAQPRDQRTYQGTRSPIELFWTAKKYYSMLSMKGDAQGVEQPGQGVVEGLKMLQDNF